jgi:hypothetical protein
MRPWSTTFPARLSATLALLAACGPVVPVDADETDETDADGTDGTDDTDDTDVDDTFDTAETDGTDETDVETDTAETDGTDETDVETDTDDTGFDTALTPQEVAMLATCATSATWTPSRPPFPGAPRTTLVRAEACVLVGEADPCPDVAQPLPWPDPPGTPGNFCTTQLTVCITGFAGRLEDTPDTGFFPDTDTGLPVDRGDRCCYFYVGETPDYICGRPFVQEGVARVAGVSGTIGWGGPVEGAPGLPRKVRAALAHRWTDDARAEHASVGAFAQLALQLLALGAPAELLDEVSRAMADEVRHARVAFALASRFTGTAVGPGPLATGAVSVPSLVELAVATAVEGGVGESLAAGFAAARLARCTDAEVRAALEAIVEDEARHAALAWRVVDWAVAQGGAAVADAVAVAVRDAVTRAHLQALPIEPEAPSLGLPGMAALARARSAVLATLA